MNKRSILVIGSGGREHAVVKKLYESEGAGKIYCAPGNGGIAAFAECVDIKATDIDGVVAFAKEKNIDLVFVTPDDPLSLGMVDALENAGIRAFGPRKNAAIIEGSKAFSKELMKKYGIPTAKYETFSNFEAARTYLIENNTYPIVIKADGLALGKGVIIAQNESEAIEAVNSMMNDKAFGDAGNCVVIEEFLSGEEVSVLAFCDGKTVVPMVSSKDHKKIFDGEKGLNTGGMGAFAPTAAYTDEIAKIAMDTIFLPTVNAMNTENRPFKGVIYFGLMIVSGKPYVIEYNSRFGDPETQVVLPLLDTDLLKIVDAVIDEKLDTIDIKWKKMHCACVVLASGGYPQSYKKGFEISGIENITDKDSFVYIAGAKCENGKLYTSGGRVLCVSSFGDTHESAVEKAYENIEKISFENMYKRNDIGRSIK